jgi:hypothetical protein
VVHDHVAAPPLVHGLFQVFVVDPFSASLEGSVLVISWLGAGSATFCHYNRRPDRRGSAQTWLSSKLRFIAQDNNARASRIDQ